MNKRLLYLSLLSSMLGLLIESYVLFEERSTSGIGVVLLTAGGIGIVFNLFNNKRTTSRVPILSTFTLYIWLFNLFLITFIYIIEEHLPPDLGYILLVPLLGLSGLVGVVLASIYALKVAKRVN